MRKTMLLLAIFGLAGSIWAADPIIGTWIPNRSKSDLPSAAAKGREIPKETKMVYQEVGDDQMQYSYIEIGSNGSQKDLGTYIFPRQGGIAKRPSDPISEDVLVISALIEPGEWFIAIIRDGKQTMLMHRIVSKDGKSLRQTTTSTDPTGKLQKQISVLDRE